LGAGFLRLLRGRLLPLEADAAQHRSALRGLEGNCRLRPALRTIGPRLRAHPGAPAGALRLALLAVLGIVLELLIVEEKLLAGSKYELGAAIVAL
jgi:hypothetical protein